MEQAQSSFAVLAPHSPQLAQLASLAERDFTTHPPDTDWLLRFPFWECRVISIIPGCLGRVAQQELLGATDDLGQDCDCIGIETS